MEAHNAVVDVASPDEGVRLSEGREAGEPAGASREPVASPPGHWPDPVNRYEPFPTTSIQQAYLVGRSNAFAMGNVACHTYYEVQAERLDIKRFNRALQKLIDRHDMLRAIIRADGSQQVLERVPSYEIQVEDLRKCSATEVDQSLSAARERLSHQMFQSDRWPLFEICASQLSDECLRLHLSFDLLIADAWSLQLLCQEWFQLYHDPDTRLAPIGLTFRDYVLAEAALHNSQARQSSRMYWSERLASLPDAPELPLAADPEEIDRPRFRRRTSEMDSRQWRELKNRALDRGLTPTAVLLAAFGEVIGAWSKSPRFSINVTLMNRLPIHRDVIRLVGDFTALFPLAVASEAADTFESRAWRLQDELLEGIEHRDFSGVEIVREVARRRNAATGIGLPVVFTSLLGQSRAGAQTGRSLWMGDIVYGVAQTPQVWIDTQVLEEEGALVCNWDAVDDLFPTGVLDDMLESYSGFLHRLSTSDATWQDLYRNLVPQSQIDLRSAVNDTELPQVTCLLHEPFLEAAKRWPDNPAVAARDRTLSYRELELFSGQVAGSLAVEGIGPGQTVAVVMERGWEQVAAVLGILRAGATYLPVNPSLPKERLSYLLENAGVRVALTQARLDRVVAWPESIDRLTIESLIGRKETCGGSQSRQTADDIAYIIYTSGSTGEPKGVVISHAAALNTILDINRRFGVGPSDRLLALSDLSFDLSVFDIFGILAAGGTLIIPDPGNLREPAHWIELMASEQVSIWNSVPAMMEMLLHYAGDRTRGLPETMRLVLLSGDWIPTPLPDRIKARVPGVRVISLGGATEASIWSILYQIDSVDPGWNSIPYGRPMSNQQFHVLNHLLEPCPTWTAGYLYIGGSGLATGYWRDEKKTSESFIHHPRTGERLYRTGDLGRYLPDGNIEFLGREDSQVKVHGYRIELGEIEAALANHPEVGSAAVKAISSEEGGKRLVAYVTGRNGEAPDPAALKALLAEKLPDYMVPSAFVILEALPLTVNGKVDRAALPDPEKGSRQSTGVQGEERSTVEDRVAEAVAQVLNLNALDCSGDLLELGATSLDIAKIVYLLEQKYGYRLRLADVCRKSITEPRLADSRAETIPKGQGGMMTEEAESISPAQAGQNSPG